MRTDRQTYQFLDQSLRGGGCTLYIPPSFVTHVHTSSSIRVFWVGAVLYTPPPSWHIPVPRSESVEWGLLFNPLPALWHMFIPVPWSESESGAVLNTPPPPWHMYIPVPWWESVEWGRWSASVVWPGVSFSPWWPRQFPAAGRWCFWRRVSARQGTHTTPETPSCVTDQTDLRNTSIQEAKFLLESALTTWHFS